MRNKEWLMREWLNEESESGKGRGKGMKGRNEYTGRNNENKCMGFKR